MMLPLFNAALRLGSLGAKLVLMLYMGRYLGLADLGTYGLVAAYVAIAIPLLGFRLDYVVSREIVEAPPLFLACKMRDQAVFYALNYLALAVVVLAALVFVPHGLDTGLVLFTLALAILESFATITSTNFVSLKQPVLSNVLFFIRAAMWTVPVMALGFFFSSYRTVNTVFVWWLVGVTLSLLITGVMLRHLPWRACFNTAVDWPTLGRNMKNCLPIWMGSVGVAVAGNIDRFVVEYGLGREFVGIASFYGSFVIAITALIESGVFSFAFPHLIAQYRDGDVAAFRQTVRKMCVQATISSALMALVIGAVVPVLGHLFGRPEFAEHVPVLWLMLAGICLKQVSEGLHRVMYARHQDRAIWVGSLLLLLVSLVSNAACVWQFGFIGIGYSAIISAIFIGLWRVWCVREVKQGEI